MTKTARKEGAIPTEKSRSLDLDASIALNTCLAQKGLKAKNVGGENYMRVITLKTTLRNALKTFDEAVTDLAEELGMEQLQPGTFSHPKQDRAAQATFVRKVKEISEKWKSPAVELNFLPETELREFCKEQDVEVESTLFEYLCKRD